MRTLILVDDESWLLELLPEKIVESQVGNAPMQILTASTAEEALAFVDRMVAAGDARAVTILSDYDLHGSLDGFELLAQIAERLPHARRVLMSSHSRVDLQEHLTRAMLDGFLEKPMIFHDWGPALQRVLRIHPTTFPAACAQA